MILAYVWLEGNESAIEYELTSEQAEEAKGMLYKRQFDFVEFGSLVLPKRYILQVKFTEVGK